MSELKCHYCWAACRLCGQADIYLHCDVCGADGPICNTPEAAAAAHAMVGLAPRWSSEPPKTPGLYAYETRAGRGLWHADVSQEMVDNGWAAGPRARYRLILPTEPPDAAEGGGL